MKKLFFAVCLLLTACGSGGSINENALGVTDAMMGAMATAANEYAISNPNVEHNAAHECRVSPADVCYDASTDSYVVTCSISSRAGLFGTVTIRDGVVTGFGTIEMASQAELSAALEGLGCK